MNSYDDIRPYNDAEVAPVLNRLVRNPQMLNAVTHFQFGGLPAFLRNMLRPVVGWKLRQMMAGVNNVRSLQMHIRPMVETVVKRTTDQLSWSGTENLPTDRPCLLLSNHRDIVMDPALVNYVMDQNELKTARIAIGDNLLSRPYVSDLMRLNKSFIVQRSITGRREKLQAFQKLSSYMAHSIDEGENVWLAHREGRAKDGDDRTDTAILKMLHMGFRQQKKSFSDMLEHMHIIPVSISYEYDPCDSAKAAELQEREANGAYSKEEDEDLNSIVTGIEGQKGRVHVAFGKAVDPALDTPQAAAENIDQQMHELYRLWPSNGLAYDLLREQESDAQPAFDWRSQFDAADVEAHEEMFRKRLQSCPESAREWMLKIYANPVVNQLKSSL